MREVMREKGVPEGFLKDLKGDPGRKYLLGNAVAYEPLTNYLDVSIKAFSSSSKPPGSSFRGCPPSFLAACGMLPPLPAQSRGCAGHGQAFCCLCSPAPRAAGCWETKAGGSTAYPELISLLRKSEV